MEAYPVGTNFRPQFKSQEVILQRGQLPRESKAAIANMADVDDDKMSIIISVTQFTMTNHRFTVQNDDGSSGVFFYWYNQVSNGFKKGVVQFLLNDTVTNIRLDYQDDSDSTEKDKQMLTKINRKGGSHELVGRFKVEILHPNIKEFYDKITRFFEKIEEPINLPQPETIGGLDEAVYEDDSGDQDDAYDDDYDFKGNNNNGLVIDPKLLGEKEKLKSVAPAGNGFGGFDFDSAVGGKGFADIFGGSSAGPQKSLGPNQPKQMGGRKSSFEDLLMFMDGDTRDASKEPVPVSKPQQTYQQPPISKPQVAKTVVSNPNPFLTDNRTPTQPTQNGYKTTVTQYSQQQGGIGLSGLGISNIEGRAPANYGFGNQPQVLHSSYQYSAPQQASQPDRTAVQPTATQPYNQRYTTNPNPPQYVQTAHQIQQRVPITNQNYPSSYQGTTNQPTRQAQPTYTYQQNPAPQNQPQQQRNFNPFLDPPTQQQSNPVAQPRYYQPAQPAPYRKP